MSAEMNINSYTNNTRVRACALAKIADIIDSLYGEVEALENTANTLRGKGDEICEKMADKADDERYACYELISFLSEVRV